jgi:hypothetical protein
MVKVSDVKEYAARYKLTLAKAFKIVRCLERAAKAWDKAQALEKIHFDELGKASTLLGRPVNVFFWEKIKAKNAGAPA